MRVGHGYDTHRLGTGIPMVLGGVTIWYARGLVAHSDGDVPIHALCDALIGAAGLALRRRPGFIAGQPPAPRGAPGAASRSPATVDRQRA